MPTNITLVYHSGYGKTKVVAQHVLKGLQSVAGVNATIVTADDAAKNLAQFDAADCIVFGCPTYMGGPSAQFKAFIDAAGSVWMKQGWKNKLAAGFTNSGGLSGDKQSTLIALMTNAMQHGMVWVGTGVSSGDREHNGQKLRVNRIGSYSGLMTQADHQAPAPPADDLATAELFGAHVAQAAVRWTKGK